jgi:hypothetical protein
MARVTITSLGPGRYGVEVSEGDVTTDHEVTVPDGFLADLGMDGADPGEAVGRSFEFLLEREPSTSILREFSLNQISRYFPEYPEELRRRAAG